MTRESPVFLLQEVGQFYSDFPGSIIRRLW